MVEQLIPPLTKTISKKPAAKEAAGTAGGATVTGPEADRAMDLVKSGVRAVLAVNAIEDIGQVQNISFPVYMYMLSHQLA